MVERSVSSIETGDQHTRKTAEQLESIVTGAERVSQFLDELAASSKEQSLAIDQITEGLGQVDQVTQSNTASAEESAAAAEELSSQSEQLRSAIATFQLNTVGDATPTLATPEPSERRNDRRPHEWQPAGDNGHQKRPVQIALDDDEGFDRF